MSHPEVVAPRPSQATVVITQHIRPGRQTAFRRWQDGVDEAAATFTGFLGTELTPPAGNESEWSVLYRFDSTNALKRWLDSDIRRDLLLRGADLFEAAPTQHVLVDETDEKPVTVVVSHPVAPGREAEFSAWQERVTQQERMFPGFRGSDLHPPIAGVQDDWTIVYTFASTDDLDRWLDSPERRALLTEADSFRDFEIHRIAGTYGSWFPTTGGGENAIASWKTALSVLVGLYPTVVVLTLALTEIWPSAQLWLSLLVGNILSVTLLTWVVMPLVTRALNFWLEPKKHSGTRTDVVGLACSIGFLTVAATLFWLVTRVVWNLP